MQSQGILSIRSDPSCVGYEGFFLALAQRAWAALRAISRRRSGDIFAIRAFPPFLPSLEKYCRSASCMARAY